MSGQNIDYSCNRRDEDQPENPSVGELVPNEITRQKIIGYHKPQFRRNVLCAYQRKGTGNRRKYDP